MMTLTFDLLTPKPEKSRLHAKINLRQKFGENPPVHTGDIAETTSRTDEQHENITPLAVPRQQK